MGKRRAKQKSSKLSSPKAVKTEPLAIEADGAIIEVEGRSSNSLVDVSNDECGLVENHDSSSAQTKISRRATRVNQFFISDKKPDIGILHTDTVVSVLDEQSLRKKYGRPTKETLKSLMSMDLIGLNILGCLSVSTLGELFSTYDSDELSRQFFYHCQLMPSRCNAVFRSYGNENKAKAAVEKHLKEHINNIVTESTGEETEVSFAAESVQARERRIENECTIEKQKVFVKLERLDALENMECPSQPSHLIDGGEQEPPTAGKKVKRKQKASRQPATKFTKPSLRSRARKPTSDLVNVKNIAIEPENDEPSVAEPHPDHSKLLTDTSLFISKNTEILAKMEAELQMSKQPYLDHQYAVLNKPIKVAARYQDASDEPNEIYSNESALKLYSLSNKHVWDTAGPSEDNSCKIDHDLAMSTYVIGARLKTGYMVSLQKPTVQIMPSVRKVIQVPVVGEEVVIEKSKPIYRRDMEEVSTGCIVDSDSDSETVTTTSLARSMNKTVKRSNVYDTGSYYKVLCPLVDMGAESGPYPPMPKYQPEMGAKLIIPEEDINLPDEENDNDADMPDEWDLNNEEHRKRYAIKCMRELKQNRGMGSRNIVVSCKICEKQFTAVATLMYHYRSHANIKPFVCLLCDATFTRQHSLNYHMLIHNGASRFKCPDCGRAFRHPSHYKEHQRRHTGEQPYQCHVCGHRFKTRNSYKRHLWSKHPGESTRLLKTTSAATKPPVSVLQEKSEPGSGNTDSGFDVGKGRSVAPAGPVVTMQVDDDNPAVKLIAENGNVLDPKQVKIVPLSLVTPGRSLPATLPTNILRNKDGKPIVLTLAQAEAGLQNFKIVNQQITNVLPSEMSAKMQVLEKQIFEHREGQIGKIADLESSNVDVAESSRADILDISNTNVQEVKITYDEFDAAGAQDVQAPKNTADKSDITIADEPNLNQTNEPTVSNRVGSIHSEEDNDTSLLCLDG